MNSIKKNFIYQISYQILVLVFPLFTQPYIARVLGAENIGTYSFTFSIANYFVLFASLGIKNYGNREIARCRDDKETLNRTFSSILGLHLIISLTVLLVYIVYIFISPIESRLYTVISGIYVVAAVFDISWFFFGIEQFKMTVVRNCVIKIACFMSIFLFVKSKNDLWVYVTILALAQLFSQVYLWFYLRKNVKIILVGAKECFQHFPQMAVLFIPTIAISLYHYMDKIMIGTISGNGQLGFYENSVTIITLSTAVIEALGTVMLPRMSNVLAKGDLSKAKKYIEASMQVMLCLSIAMTCGLIGISNVFAPVFWGNEFSGCALLISVLALTIPFKAYANIIRTQYLIPSKMDKQYITSVCAGAAINLVINYSLIPNMGSVGAAIGTIAAEGTVCFTQAFACRKSLPVIQYVRLFRPYALIGMIMIVAVRYTGYVLGNTIVSLAIQIFLGVILYCSFCLVLFLKEGNELFLNPIKKIINIKRNK